MAGKEIHNLTASDRHPNILRWYGMKYDQDFVYLCVEHCKGSLHEITSRDQNHEFHSYIHCNMQLMRTFGSNVELELWKASGYPSPWLLKLMRYVQGQLHQLIAFFLEASLIPLLLHV